MRMIFVNLPVKDLEASKTFFGALGFTFNPAFTDENAACMVVSESIFVMLLTQARFRDFTVFGRKRHKRLEGSDPKSQAWKMSMC